MFKHGNTSFDRYLEKERPIIWLVTGFSVIVATSIFIWVCWIFESPDILASLKLAWPFVLFITFIIIILGRSADQTYRAISLSRQTSERRDFENRKRKVLAEKDVS